MTVQDMDICLNISADPAAAATKNKREKQDDDILNSMRKIKNQTIAKKKVVNKQTKSAPIKRTVDATKRVKQKHLSEIVAKKLKESKVGQPKSILKQSKEKPAVVKAKSIDRKGIAASIKAPSKVRFETVDSNQSSLNNNKVNNDNSQASDVLNISFTKLTKENVGKTLLAKKRNISDTTPKKSLSDIFSQQSGSKNKEFSLLSKTGKIDSDESVVPNKKLKFQEPQKSKSQDPKDSKFLEFKKAKFQDPERSNFQVSKKTNFPETESPESHGSKNAEFYEPEDPKPQDFKNQVNSKKPSFDKKAKKHKQKTETKTGTNDKGSNFHHKSTGKISSLFGHNPEVPNIGQRFVKPINEPIFTGINFTDINVHPFTISNLEQNMSITKMTTVQQKAIPQIFSGKDILIRSQTGSGKTLAYALPIVECLHKIRPKLNRNDGLKALVVVPTRELALQTYECFLKLIKPFTWIVPGYLTGGEKRKAEKARLRKGCNILVGTPGRLLDHIKHTAALKLNEVEYFVLDEADRMFDMGYEKDISGIVSALKGSDTKSDGGYDAMQMLRKNIKKVFTEDDINVLEDDPSKESPNTSSNKKEDPESDNESDDKTQETKKKIEYHSSSESETEEGEPFVKSERTQKQAFPKSTSQEEPNKIDIQLISNETDTDIVDKSRRQTILLSATLTHSVEKLAGLTMENPIFVDAAKENLENTGGDVNDINEDLIVPQSVVQSYVITPPKLRMVTLSAYIAGKCQSAGQHKILVFMATQDMVDYHTEILSSILTKPVDENDEDSDPLVDVEFFKLYGNMSQKDRTNVFKTFRQAKSGVLLCTDVASRGLDMPKVDCVIQYTGPTSPRDYVHRIGRTARAGCSGIATIFLTPPEIEFVRMLESRRIRIKQEDMDDILGKLLGPLSVHHSAQTAAIALQNEFETLVIENKKIRDKAHKAYVSWVRFYASYPRDMREIFNRKELHLGHYAKSFALRDPPQRIGGFGKNLKEADDSQRQHNNRLTNERPVRVPRKEKRDQDGGRKTGSLRKVRMLNTSEYGSGLEPVKKPKKS